MPVPANRPSRDIASIPFAPQRASRARLPLCMAISLALGCVEPAFADEAANSARIAVLEARIAELERHLATAVPPAATATATATAADQADIDELTEDVRIVQRRLDIKDEEAAAAAVPSQPLTVAGEKGFALQTRDQSYSIRLRGLIQADSREFFNDETLASNADTFALSRVRPIIEGTLAGFVDYRFTPDFGNGRTVIQDAYVDARFDPRAKVRVGKFKTPFGIERLQSASDIRFVVRALPNNLVPNRDIGVQLHGDVLGGALGYQLAYFNGVNDGRSSEDYADVDNNADKDFAGRVFGQPFFNSDNYWLRGLGVGIAGTWSDARGDITNTLLPIYRTPGQFTFFTYRTGATATYADGERLRWSPQLTWYGGRFGVLSEYVQVDQDVARQTPTGRRTARLNQEAWQLALNYVITGEEASYKDIKPKAPFKLGAPGWGALEAVARVSELNVDNATFTGGSSSFADPAVAASDARAWGVGLNWYLNRNLKYVLDYEQTVFEGGAPGGRDRPTEKVVYSRVQVSF